MSAAALGALAGIAGTIGSIPLGYRKSSESLLSFPQLLNEINMTRAMQPRMGDHFRQLANLGQNAISAYDSAPSFASEYAGKIYGPSRQRIQGMSEQLGDPYHRRASVPTQQRFREESRMANNTLRNKLMVNDLGFAGSALGQAYGRQQDALGMMTDAWMMPMGKVRENYMMPDQTGNIIVGGMQGLSTLGNIFNNLRKESNLAGGIG